MLSIAAPTSTTPRPKIAHQLDTDLPPPRCTSDARRPHPGICESRSPKRLAPALAKLRMLSWPTPLVIKFKAFPFKYLHQTRAHAPAAAEAAGSISTPPPRYSACRRRAAEISTNRPSSHGPSAQRLSDETPRPRPRPSRVPAPPRNDESGGRPSGARAAASAGRRLIVGLGAKRSSRRADGQSAIINRRHNTGTEWVGRSTDRLLVLRFGQHPENPGPDTETQPGPSFAGSCIFGWQPAGLGQTHAILDEGNNPFERPSGPTLHSETVRRGIL